MQRLNAISTPDLTDMTFTNEPISFTEDLSSSSSARKLEKPHAVHDSPATLITSITTHYPSHVLGQLLRCTIEGRSIKGPFAKYIGVRPEELKHWCASNHPPSSIASSPVHSHNTVKKGGVVSSRLDYLIPRLCNLHNTENSGHSGSPTDSFSSYGESTMDEIYLLQMDVLSARSMAFLHDFGSKDSIPKSHIPSLIQRFANVDLQVNFPILFIESQRRWWTHLSAGLTSRSISNEDVLRQAEWKKLQRTHRSLIGSLGPHGGFLSQIQSNLLPSQITYSSIISTWSHWVFCLGALHDPLFKNTRGLWADFDLPNWMWKHKEAWVHGVFREGRMRIIRAFSSFGSHSNGEAYSGAAHGLDRKSLNSLTSTLMQLATPLTISLTVHLRMVQRLFMKEGIPWNVTVKELIRRLHESSSENQKLVLAFKTLAKLLEKGEGPSLDGKLYPMNDDVYRPQGPSSSSSVSVDHSSAESLAYDVLEMAIAKANILVPYLEVPEAQVFSKLYTKHKKDIQGYVEPFLAPTMEIMWEIYSRLNHPLGQGTRREEEMYMAKLLRRLVETTSFYAPVKVMELELEVERDIRKLWAMGGRSKGSGRSRVDVHDLASKYMSILMGILPRAADRIIKDLSAYYRGRVTYLSSIKSGKSTNELDLRSSLSKLRKSLSSHSLRQKATNSASSLLTVHRDASKSSHSSTNLDVSQSSSHSGHQDISHTSYQSSNQNHASTPYHQAYQNTSQILYSSTYQNNLNYPQRTRYPSNDYPSNIYGFPQGTFYTTSQGAFSSMNNGEFQRYMGQQPAHRMTYPPTRRSQSYYYRY